MKTKVQLFFALFFAAAGSLFTLLCCGTEYWLLASRSRSRTCGPTHEEEEETWLKLLSNSLGWRRHARPPLPLIG